jgi:hypothetical protein
VGNYLVGESSEASLVMNYRITILAAVCLAISAVGMAAEDLAKVGGAKPYTPVARSPKAAFWSMTRSPDGGRFALSDGLRRVAVNLRPVSMEIRSEGKSPGITSAGSLWRLRTGDQVLQSDDFEGTIVEARGPVITVEVGDRRGLGISGVLTFSLLDQSGLLVDLELSSRESRRVQINFPTISGIKHSDGKAVSYCFPRRGSVINSIPIELREPYSGLMPLQFMDAYGPSGGVYLLTRDMYTVYRYFLLSKNASGVFLGVEYPEQEIGPSTRSKSVPTVLGFHQGDWHAALDIYKTWVRSWYKPDAPRKDWFRRVFNFRQQFMRFYIPGGEKYYDKATKKYTFAEGIADDAKAFGGVDFLHLFDWGASEKWGRCGDYEPWDEIGGVEAFRAAVKETQDAGIPVGLYIEGYLIDPQSRIAQAHGKEWEILDAQGKPLPFFAPAMNMCSAVTGWQDYLAGVYARVKKETGAMGYYCDEMGFADPSHFCYAPNHGHPVPQPPTPGQRELIRKIRRALGPESALYTEETPCDTSTQHQDGSFTYAISSVRDEWSPSHVNLTRFALPDFKTFEIITCDNPIANQIVPVRQIFFNGEGIWLEGPSDKWFAPEVLDFIRKMHGIMRKYEDCFTSLYPTPLVPTGEKMVFANQFPGKRRILWTLFNANDSAVRGELLAANHSPGAKYYDVWNGREIKPRISNGIAYLNLELAPRDVGCIVKESHG